MKAKRILTVFVAAVTVVSMLGAPSTAAPKKWSKILVSQDGHTWSPNLTKPLFPSGVPWVPGDSEIRTFYIRNRSGERAQMGLVVQLNDGSRLVATRQLRMSVKVGNRPWVQVLRSTQQVVRMALKAGAVVRVRVQVAIPTGAVNSSMRKNESFKLTVRMTSLRKS